MSHQQDHSMSDDQVIIVSTYSRSEAIKEGYLIDCSKMAEEAGFKIPVALTKKVWNQSVRWTSDRFLQDEEGRLWGILYMASHAIRNAKVDAYTLDYIIQQIPSDSITGRTVDVPLKLQFDLSDNGNPAITIMNPNED